METCDLYWKRSESVAKKKDIIYKLEQIWLDQDVTRLVNSWSLQILSIVLQMNRILYKVANDLCALTTNK